MEKEAKKNIGCIIIITGFISTLIIILLNQFTPLGDLNFISSDISLSNTSLCLIEGTECLVLEENTFFDDDFFQIRVCTDYSSSQPASLSVILFPKDDFPAFGKSFERISVTGSFEICYLLMDLVDSMENSNTNGSFPNPVTNGVLDPGHYQVVFEQGRERLDVINFQVLSSE